MANIFYNTGKQEIINRTIDLINDTLKVMLVNASYVANADDDVVDAGGANDPVDHEITATNYARGWGASGRKSLSSKAINQDDTNDRSEFDAADLTWTALGGAANDTVAAAILIKEGGANDTTSRLIAYFDIPNTPTNGGDFTLQWNAEGLLQF